MPFEQAEGLMTQKLKKAFLESKNEEWKKKVKGHYNLAEHYFNYNISDEKWIELRDKASNNLKGFYAIDENEIIKNSDSSNWITIDKLDSFDYNGTTIYASPDFAFNENDNLYQLHIDNCLLSFIILDAIEPGVEVVVTINAVDQNQSQLDNPEQSVIHF